MILKISNILVSQPTPESMEKSPFNIIVEKFKSTIKFYPIIKVKGVSLKDFRSQRIDIVEYSAVIFNSRAMIDNFFRICEEARISINDNLRYICSTEAVALYLQKYIVYRKRKISFADGTFSAFMKLIMKYRDEKLLLTLADPHKTEIPDAMEQLNLNFDKVILSHSISADLSEIKITDYDLMVLYTPKEVSIVTSMFDTNKLPLIATFGEGTTRAAINAGIVVNVMAPTPSAPSMSKALELFIDSIKDSDTAPIVEISTTAENKVNEFIKLQKEQPIKKVRSKRVSTDK